jgi:Dolichyl-phosphate-mannose-protein mannosyltransferase
VSASILIFAVALPVLISIGYIITALTLPPPLARRLAWALAPGVGAGLCSLIFFVFRRPLFTAEAVVLVVLVWLLSRHRRISELLPSAWRPTNLGIFLCAALGLVFAIFLLEVDRMPHGGWDGWAIWNTHARVLYRDGPNWQNTIQYTYQGDYPLLAPALAARFWRYAGREVPEAGAIAGIMLGLSGIGLLAAVLSELRDARLAALFTLILIGTPVYLDYSAAQYADVPFSFFVLATIALVCIHGVRESEEAGILILAGFTAGCAGWTKNEGLLLIAAVLFALVLPIVSGRSKLRNRLIPFLAGLTIPLLVIIAFKRAVPVRSYLVEDQTLDLIIQRITNPDRYLITIRHLLRTAWNFGAWSITPLLFLFVLVAVKGIDPHILRSAGWRTGCLILLTIAVGYFCIYIVSPIDLQVHLDTSAYRLMIHFWPSFLLLLGLCTQTSQPAN